MIASVQGWLMGLITIGSTGSSLTRIAYALDDGIETTDWQKPFIRVWGSQEVNGRVELAMEEGSPTSIYINQPPHKQRASELGSGMG